MMNTKNRVHKDSAEKAVRDIRRATRRHYSAEEKIRIVLEGLRGEDSIAELCRKEGDIVLRSYSLRIWSQISMFLDVNISRLLVLHEPIGVAAVAEVAVALIDKWNLFSAV